MSKTFYVVNTVRSVHTRLARFQSPERHRFKQFILGGTTRLVRARPVPITEEQLEEHFEELKAKQKSGAVQVRHDTSDGPLFDFTKKVKKEKAPKPKAAPKPEPAPEPEPVPEPEPTPDPEPEPVPEPVVETAPEPEPVMEEEMEPPPPPPPPKPKKSGRKKAGKKKKG